MNLNVAIVDDHPLVLEGLKSLLLQTEGIEHIYTAQTGSQLGSLLALHSIHLYIIDLDLPDIDGFELIHQIKQKSPEAKIIVSTMHEEIWIVNKLKHPDIDAVVFKSSAGEYIQKALQTVLKGKKYYCPQFQKLYKEKDKIGPPRHPRFCSYHSGTGCTESHSQRNEYPRNIRMSLYFREYSRMAPEKPDGEVRGQECHRPGY